MLLFCIWKKEKTMDLLLRTQQLSTLFSEENRVVLPDSDLEIIPFRFTNMENEALDFHDEICQTTDSAISENNSFTYYVFAHKNQNYKRSEAIILLHGLNERSWKKYLTWAESLAKETGKAVILFPLAFHMNRSSLLWTNLRSLMPFVDKRKNESIEMSNATVANVVLSNRLSSNPIRFYTSGRTTANNICQLVSDIKEGKHPLFAEDTSVHFFAYSIGALLAQVLLLGNPRDLFSNTRLFMFCGGSIFNRMNGSSRDIIDSSANDSLQYYYVNEFLSKNHTEDGMMDAFLSMIKSDSKQSFRESFFQKAANRVRAISLKNDTVIPTTGVASALGGVSSKILEELDFPFEYSHQNPFPLTGKVNKELLSDSFNSVFSSAASFL
jgi:pimeloyl-ACP methyl ester carboxylesterase